MPSFPRGIFPWVKRRSLVWRCNYLWCNVINSNSLAAQFIILTFHYYFIITVYYFITTVYYYILLSVYYQNLLFYYCSSFARICYFIIILIIQYYMYEVKIKLLKLTHCIIPFVFGFLVIVSWFHFMFLS